MRIDKSTIVDTKPTKRFFVEMLTRDIAVEDAILDLLDNCVDGILRGKSPEELELARPYEGYWANITLSGDRFEIEDNCGGIPWGEHDRAFRMGRALGNDEAAPKLSVGAYGIGMKRAVFKMGDHVLISTQNNGDAYEVLIDSDWMSEEDKWELGVEPAQEPFDTDGTLIMVESLDEGVAIDFASEAFADDLLDKIASHYAIIIGKGFEVFVNGRKALPKPIQIRFAPESGDGLRPYIFKSDENDVEVFVAIGLRDPIPDAEQLLSGQTENQTGSDYAGWTVICNDRVVLSNNKDELTGWGTPGIPQYHTQFISISGVVEFKGDPRKLPTTTTKRGLEYSSRLYQQVLRRMQEGMRVFIDFTNDWKTRTEDVRQQTEGVPSIAFPEIKERVEAAANARTLTLNPVQTGLKGYQSKPNLPEPQRDSPDARISYFREKERIEALAEALMPETDGMKDVALRKMVGEKSFEFAYEQLVEKG